MPFRARKRVPIIPGFVYLNLSGSTGKNTGTRGGASWTFRLGKLASYSTRDGKYRVNTPGLGWWESGTRSQRRKKKLDKRVAKAAAGAPPRTPQGRAQKADQQAAVYAKWFRDLRREGVPEDEVAKTAQEAGRCPDCGNPMRRGSWCVPCAERAQRRQEQAAARAEARSRQEDRLYGTPAAEPPPGGGSVVRITSPPHLAGLDAGEVEHGIDEGRYSLDPEVDAELARRGRPPGGVVNAGAHRRPSQEQGNGYGMPFAERQAQFRERGWCGARTQKDGTPCLNKAGTCPHHGGVFA